MSDTKALEDALLAVGYDTAPTYVSSFSHLVLETWEDGEYWYCQTDYRSVESPVFTSRHLAWVKAHALSWTVEQMYKER